MSKKRELKAAKKHTGTDPVQAKKTNYWMLGVIILFTLIAFSPVFKADFVSWDDPDYVTNNRSVQTLNIGEIITKPVQGNYHPLTMLSLAFNYAISGKDATSYHVVNLLIHLLNLILVFYFVYHLSGRKHWMAFVTALLFAIHPLHVESVAWVAERKDVLYSFFFLAGLIAYLRYTEKRTLGRLSVVLLLFLLSLLSKPAAVIFPLVLLALDFYYGRLRDIKTYLEKIPFLLFSVLFGLLTLHGQTAQGAVSNTEIFPFHFKFFFGFYGIMMYLVKTIVPFSLCTFYPYPPLNQTLPAIYYLSPLVTLGLAILFFATYRKDKIIAFAILFYIINLALVLQFFPVGSAIIADRYTYLPLIGVFIVMGHYFQKWADVHHGKPNTAGIVVLATVTLILTILTYKQAATWKDSASIWNKAISVAPSSRAYTNLGLIYKRANQNAKAIEMYTMAISLNKVDEEAMINRGNIYFNEKKYDLAIADYDKCLAIDPLNPLAIENRASAFVATGLYEQALQDFNKALKLDPNSTNGYDNRALVKQILNQHESAIEDFHMHMKYSPDETGNTWNAIGVSYMNLNQFDKALECFNKALGLSENPVFLYNRALALVNTGNIQQARTDTQRAVQLGAKIDPAFLNRLK